MIDKRINSSSLIFNEFNDSEKAQWFDFKQRKFLHNIDTFYYSVKFKNDFRIDTKDEYVRRFRKFFEIKYAYLDPTNPSESLYLKELGKELLLRPATHARYYSICLSYPEYFDIFFAPSVPRSSDGGDSVTCECIVQLRSYFLWQFNIMDCFENSYEYVKSIANFFHLEIDFVQENRMDFCWHSNYLQDPDAFFSMDKFYRDRVDRFRNAQFLTNKVGSESYEIDYVAMGKRSNKIFVRIYQKVREVIEQGYKPWFFKIWKMNGLINNYDLYVYEKAFLRHSWHYRFYARLEFYAEYGRDPEMVERCRAIVDGKETISQECLFRLADQLTPKLNTVINVEYQVMRRALKSFELIPLGSMDKSYAARISLLNKNRKLIMDYLTHDIFRLTDYDPDIPKYEREDCGFWKALRRTKCMDVRNVSDYAKIVRNYKNKLSSEVVKNRFINSAVTYGLYTRGSNRDNVLQDAFEAMLRLNDNDIEMARRKKSERLRRLNPEELAEVFVSDDKHSFQFVDEFTGEVYSYDTLVRVNMQEEAKKNEFCPTPEDFSFDEE